MSKNSSVKNVEGRIYIDGIPASNVGRMVATHSALRNAGVTRNEVAMCRRCKTAKPVGEFGGRTLSENRKGLAGVCDPCFYHGGARP
jgi:hypothetical protein